jgi:hypothetical protein
VEESPEMKVYKNIRGRNIPVQCGVRENNNKEESNFSRALQSQQRQKTRKMQ